MRFLVLYNGRIHPNGGAGGSVWQTTRSLIELGHTVTQLGEGHISRSIDHHNLHYALELPHRILQAVQRAMEHEPFDVLLLSQPYGYLVGKWLRTQRNRPVYLHRSHGHELVATHQTSRFRMSAARDSRSWWRRAATRTLGRQLARQARRALRYADGTIVPSNFDRDYLVGHEGADPERVRVIHHAAVPEYLEKPLSAFTAARHRRLLYVGNLTSTKGLGVLPQVVSAVLRAHPDVTFTAVSPRGEHVALRSGLEPEVLPRVDLRDWMDQAELLSLYDSHGVQLIPSLYEGASKAHYEGMSRGLCVIGSEVGAMIDSIEDGVNGCLATPGDVAAFVAKTEAVLRDFGSAATMSDAAVATAHRATWRRNASEIVTFAQEMIDRSAHAGASA